MNPKRNPTDNYYGQCDVPEIYRYGSEEFIFSNGSLVIKHLSWSRPVEFYINEEAVSLSWTNNYSQEIPIVLPDKFEVIQTYGRRTIYPVETADGLVLSVTDEDVGEDFYSN